MIAPRWLPCGDRFSSSFAPPRRRCVRRAADPRRDRHGKELLARALHEPGRARPRAVRRVNCAAIPETLLESELFGYEKGAFTGARRRQAGPLRAGARRHAVPRRDRRAAARRCRPSSCASLQEQRVRCAARRHHAPIRVDVRIVAATNRDLEQEVAGGRFREDLYYRLNVVADRAAAAARARRRRAAPGRSTSCASSARDSGAPSGRSARRARSRCSATRGRATSAS